MKNSEGTRCEHCDIIGIDKSATNRVDFFGEEVFLCKECLNFAKEQGLVNEETYGVKRSRK